MLVPNSEVNRNFLVFYHQQKTERADLLAKKTEESNIWIRRMKLEDLRIPRPTLTANEEALILQRVKTKIAQRLASGGIVDRSIRLEHLRWHHSYGLEQRYARKQRGRILKQQLYATETEEEKTKRLKEERMTKAEIGRISNLIKQAQETDEEEAIRIECEKMIASKKEGEKKLNMTRLEERGARKERTTKLSKRNRKTRETEAAERKKETNVRAQEVEEIGEIKTIRWDDRGRKADTERSRELCLITETSISKREELGSSTRIKKEECK